MNDTLTCCNRTYLRTSDGWHYHWGEPVPGAVDLTLADLMLVDEHIDCAETVGTFRSLTRAERRWLSGDHGAIDEMLLRGNASGRPPHAGDLIIGLLAPELHVQLMLTVGEIARAAKVSKATIDSYRYRGYLPEPQVTQGRTPLWARPVVSRWLATRPGPGWRTDLYETGPLHEPGGALATSVPATGDQSTGHAPAPMDSPDHVGVAGGPPSGRTANPRHGVPHSRPARAGAGRAAARKAVARPNLARPTRPAIR